MTDSTFQQQRSKRRDRQHGGNQSNIVRRETFSTSRQADFFSEEELTKQTGHPKAEWPLVIIRELIDNALDAADESDNPPVISVVANGSGISVADNGSGIPAETIAGALDFNVRVSSRAKYVAPDRGRQGNALKTLIPMPHVLSPEQGRCMITAHGVEHNLLCRLDPISQEVLVDDIQTPVPDKPGTVVRIEWPFDGRNCSNNEAEDEDEDEDDADNVTAMSLLRGVTLFNPHLTLDVDWFGAQFRIEPTDTSWRKWKPNQPTSPHWYEQRHLERLVAACIAKDRLTKTDRTVAAFVATFEGLSATAKQKAVLAETGLSRVNLSALLDDQSLKMDVISRLLDSMRRLSKPVKPERLGVLGKDHLATRFAELGCDPQSFDYTKTARIDNGMPFVVESAFGWRGDDAPARRLIFTGANWSPGIHNPFRSFGQTGEGLEALLNRQHAGAKEPVVFLLHLAHPRVEYPDPGKSAVVIA